MFKYIVNVPVSRFRRELNAWMRFLENEPENTIHVTRNNKVVLIAISPQRYEREKLEIRRNL
jgi:PHD/YefM family antitoxin component YafN of YafNO toxin-antitoxin module